MLEEQKKKLKEMFSWKPEENNKRKIENIVVFMVLLIITVIIINSVWNNKQEEKKQQNDIDKVLAEKNKEQITEEQVNTTQLEQKLKNILEKIEGVGKVEVLLTYSQSSQTMAMYNEDNSKSDTEETDTRTAEIEK